jgi:hypothetical protein
MRERKADFPLIKLAIVTPVFDDWTSFLTLITDLEAALQKLNCRAEIIAVDDCSSERPPTDIATAHFYPIRDIGGTRFYEDLTPAERHFNALKRILERAEPDYKN